MFGKGRKSVWYRGARLEAAVGIRNVKHRACPSFPIIVSKFAKDLLNELKPIWSGLNREITLHYIAAGSAMCYS